MATGQMRSMIVALAVMLGCGACDGGGDGGGGAVPSADVADVLTVDGGADATEPGTDTAPLEPPAPFTDEVVLSMGIVQGTIEEGVRRFRGIPYAASPVGANRWRSPQPVVPWDTVLDASARGPACPQLNALTGAPNDNGDEDCLYLSVFTPAQTPEAHLPVMVWLHGGAFIGGSGESDIYDGGGLVAAGDVVVVGFH